MQTEIIVKGVRTHNLKNIDVTLPREKLIVITGLSGSGKSSLAFDTIYAEGQRRYVESLSAYARQFLSVMEKPDIDHINGLSPAISIQQKATSHNPRSTVGTITEIHDYLRLLYSRIGLPYCPNHQLPLHTYSISQMVDKTLSLPEGTICYLLAPVIQDKKGENKKLLSTYQQEGYLRVRIDGKVYTMDELPNLEPKIKHSIDIVVDRFKVTDGIQQRLAESFETALRLADGLATILEVAAEKKETRYSSKFSCQKCGFSLSNMEPRIFSFNSPHGACQSCDGLGTSFSFEPTLIVIDSSLSLAGGAIRGWDRNHKYYFTVLEAVAKHYKFDLETPYQELPQAIQKVILYGSEKTKIPTLKSRFSKNNRSFEGIIPNMIRHYEQTEISAVREELSKYRIRRICEDCKGARLNPASRSVLVSDTSLHTLNHMPIDKLMDFIKNLDLKGNKLHIGTKIITEIYSRVKFLVDVGLGYLSLDRTAETLSGGELQRIRLASQIGAGLVGVMYVLDEPSIGLHQIDNARLLSTLTHLRDIGNTVIVVEHDEEAINIADHVLDIGPGAGIHGGYIVAQGTPRDIKNNPKSLTGNYLSGKKSITIPKTRAKANHGWLQINNAHGNNLKNIDVRLPVGLMTCITGVSGSGKSTLINSTLSKVAASELNNAAYVKTHDHDSIEGLDLLDKVIIINQSPIGRTPRSNPATYTGLFAPLRELMASTPESRARGYQLGRFSFNVKGGRCETCQGDGVIKVEMHFLSDSYITCEICNGSRYTRETLEIRFKGKNIYEILQMPIEEAVLFFENIPSIHRKLQTLMSVGLSYLTLGQSATNLSGGEAQRIKLAKELSKKDTGKTLYILDEPTTGLHFHDINQLLVVLNSLKKLGNTIVVIEHNLDVIKTADWVIDLGPEGGTRGGEVISSGTPETVAKNKQSYTGQLLKKILKLDK